VVFTFYACYTHLRDLPDTLIHAVPPCCAAYASHQPHAACGLRTRTAAPSASVHPASSRRHKSVRLPNSKSTRVNTRVHFSITPFWPFITPGGSVFGLQFYLTPCPFFFFFFFFVFGVFVLILNSKIVS
jgi:hypothetical protein